MAELIRGVDVASYQPSSYEVKGLDFVFVKATEATGYVNPKLAAQAARGRDSGLVVGFYHFLRKGNPEAQAAYFLKRAGARANEILACDWESAPDGSTPSNDEKDRFIRECVRLAPRHRVILYCNRDYWLNRERSNYAGDGLWIADPSAPEGHPRISHPWLFHQYSISGGMDRNLGNFPTRAALQAWAKGSEPASTGGIGGGAMALTADQTYAAVWKTDKVPTLADASDAQANPTWQPVSVLRDVWASTRDTQARVRALEGEVAALRAQLDAMAASLTQLDVSGALGALQAAINATTITLSAGGGNTP
ncbi:GH25 family lysozyme [Streptomyces sp. NBC_01451]|uniref:GH25 family lysozyme n=1 Tax=Streptomyces sp. NBC_01451 TaxID=2903872 RepID=UPI002E34FF66|nr:GH25 family lysozyme [Streptomyces sp. NBC_01451]